MGRTPFADRPILVFLLLGLGVLADALLVLPRP
jgi:hypothetical protein